jgi:hypothetical protein
MFWSLSLAFVAVVPWWLRPPDPTPSTAGAIAQSSWPLAVAGIVALAALSVWRYAGRPRIPVIPEGDVLLPLEQGFLMTSRALFSASQWLRARKDRGSQIADDQRRRAWALIQGTGRFEARLDQWPVAMVLAMLIGALVALIANR